VIKSKLMFCAEGIVIDAQSNNVSVFNIIEEVTPESLPLFFARFTVFILLERDASDDPSEIECSLRIALNDTNTFDQQVTANFQDKKRTRNVVVFGGLPITQPGTLKVSCWLDEHELGHYQIHVNEPRQVKTSVTPYQG